MIRALRLSVVWCLAIGVPAIAAAQVGRCEPPAAPRGRVINVAGGNAGALADAVRQAVSGTTILLRDGTYRLTGPLIVRTPGLTIRSASGNARGVVIDAGYVVAEPVYIEASETTIADVTITRAVDHLVHIVPAAQNLRAIRLRGLRLIDAGEQFVKANPNAARTAFVDDVVVECSEFTMTDDGRPRVETLGGTSCYTGGVDVIGGRGWVVRWNRFEGIFCRTGFMAEHAVHVWQSSRDTVVDGNLIINCARGIGFGLQPGLPVVRRWDDVSDRIGGLKPADSGKQADYVGHFGGVIRNNVIYADIPEYDTGIGLEQARDARVIHNTVFAGANATKAFSSIDARFGNTRAVIQNNLVNRITLRDMPTVTASHNLEQASVEDFVDVSRLDFHLRPGSRANGAGTSLPDAGADMDGAARSARPSVGAFASSSTSRSR